MAGVIELRMHFGGYFDTEPKIQYVNGGYSIIENMSIEEVLKISTIHRIHKQLDSRNNAKARFYYRDPDGDFDKGLTEVNDDTSLHVMHFEYDDMPFLELFAVVNDENVDNMNNDTDKVQTSEDSGSEDEQLNEDEPMDLFIDGIDMDVGDEDDIVTTLHATEPPLGTQRSVNVEFNLDAVEPTITECELENVGPSNVGPSETRQVNEDDWNDIVDMEEQLLDSYGNPLDDVIEEEDFLRPDFTFKVGQKFSTPQTFRTALKEWNVRNGYAVRYIKNENKRITAQCNQGCSWRIHASPMQGGQLFQVKSFNGEHTCGRQYVNKHCNSRYIAQRYVENVRDDPTCSVKNLVKVVKRDLNVDCSYPQACKAKRKALEMINGTDADQYKRLQDFCATLSKTNPGTTCKIKFQDMVLQTNGVGDLVNSDGQILDETPLRTFERFYVCLSACKRGFLSGCRPVIGLDGCFLKGSFKGQLLSAIGRDGNDNMYPIAIAVVEAERYESWKWFLELLLDDIGGLDERKWVLMSDRQKGLSIAIAEVFPGCEHRFCVRHMYENFKKKFKGKMLRDLFWKAASVGNKAEFNKAMEMIDKADPLKEGSECENAAGWLKKIPPETWSRSHFSTHSKCPVLVNNINESFNSYILPARELPIIDMVNWIRRALMRRIQVKKAGMMKYEGVYCPSIMEQLEKNKERSRNCFATYAGEETYEVLCGQHVYVVNLRLKTCSCGMFELSGIPCPHAIPAIQIHKGRVDRYVDEFFKKDMFILAYSFMIHPVPSMLFWEKTEMSEIIPPLLRKQPGRPRKLRRKDPEELKQNQQSTRKNLTVTCAICKKSGHNSRTCNRRNTVRHARGSDSQQQPLRDFSSMSNANTVRHAGGSDSQQQPLRDFSSMSNANTVRHAGGSDSQQQSLQDFPSMSNASSTSAHVARQVHPDKNPNGLQAAQKFQTTRHKQSGKQPTQVTPKRSNIEEVAQKGGQHDFPPRRSPRLQETQRTKQVVQKLTVISKAKSKKLGDSTMIAQANFAPRRSPRGSISESTSQVPLKPHKPGVAMNLAQKFGKTQSK